MSDHELITFGESDAMLRRGFELVTAGRGDLRRRLVAETREAVCMQHDM
jgi:hypothetical protein